MCVGFVLDEVFLFFVCEQFQLKVIDFATTITELSIFYVASQERIHALVRVGVFSTHV